jgi:ribonuclease HI
MPLNGTRYLTITVDASFSHEKKLAGVAAHFIFDGPKGVERWRSSAVLEAVNSSMAEYAAIVYGLGVAFERSWHLVDRVIVNSDCEAAINSANGIAGINGLHEDFRRMMLYFRTEIIRAGAALTIRKVKAHTRDGSNKPNEYLNNRVDELAKERLRNHGNARKAGENEAAAPRVNRRGYEARKPRGKNQSGYKRDSRTQQRFLAGPGDWEFS